MAGRFTARSVAGMSVVKNRGTIWRIIDQVYWTPPPGAGTPDSLRSPAGQMHCAGQASAMAVNNLPPWV